MKKFIESYIRSIQEHEQQLLTAVSEARKTKMEVVNFHRQELLKNTLGADQALKFGEELISEGSDIEVCTKIDGQTVSKI